MAILGRKASSVKVEWTAHELDYNHPYRSIPRHTCGGASSPDLLYLFVMSIDPITGQQPSVAMQVIDLQLQQIRKNPPSPTTISRSLFLTSMAMNDALAAFDKKEEGFARSYRARRFQKHDQSDIVAAAGIFMLKRLYPDQKEFLDDKLKEIAPDLTRKEYKLGRKVAKMAYRSRKNDGIDNNVEFYPSDSGDINAWQPPKVPTGVVVNDIGTPIATENPESYYVPSALSPGHMYVRPAVMESGDQFRAPAPPRYGSDDMYVDALGNVSTEHDAFVKQFKEVVDVQANMTAVDKVTAEYWADGPMSSTPPGHWNEINMDLCLKYGNDLKDDVKSTFLLNAALMDAGIAAWDSKYHWGKKGYGVRPQTAIRKLFADDEIQGWKGPNKGIDTITGSDWQPYQSPTFVTPSFPEFVSGHSTFSGAAAEVLSKFYGSDEYYDGVSKGYDHYGDGKRHLVGEYTTTDLVFEDYDGEPITLRWDTLQDAADDAGWSRLPGGIHIQDGDLRGREMGQQIGELVYETLA